MIEGRIIKGIGGLYFVDTDQGVFQCTIRGIFRKHKITPAIGDYVEIEEDKLQSNKANIIQIKPRKTELIRPKVVNVDQAIIMFSLVYPNINYDLLDKFIVLAEEQKLQILICINKMDLIEESTVEYVEKVYKKIGYNIVYISKFDKNIMEILKKYLNEKVSVFCGTSGVGKSTIINILKPTANMEIGELSNKIKRGKNTTKHSELLSIGEKTFILDTPGFSSIDLSKIKSMDLKFLFREFEQFNGLCKYSDCNHINEPNCRVKEQIGLIIDETRYMRYKNIFLELEQNKGF